MNGSLDYHKSNVHGAKHELCGNLFVGGGVAEKDKYI